jgi:hypothetical protein
MPAEPGFPRDSGPIAYFLTWTTYGSWLPGDPRGWMSRGGDARASRPRLHGVMMRQLPETIVMLSVSERQIVQQAIETTCIRRGWVVHGSQCRTQHVHAVITAADERPKTVLVQSKSWATRTLDAASGRAHLPRRWWTRGGSIRFVYGERALAQVVEYVMECQDRPRS